MSAAMAREEHAGHAVEATKQQRVRGHAPGRRYLPPNFVLETFNVVKAGTADDADDGLDRCLVASGAHRRNPFIATQSSVRLRPDLSLHGVSESSHEQKKQDDA